MWEELLREAGWFVLAIIVFLSVIEIVLFLIGR